MICHRQSASADILFLREGSILQMERSTGAMDQIILHRQLFDAAFHSDLRQQRANGFGKVCPDIGFEFFIDHLFHHVLIWTDAVFCKEGVAHIDHRVF